MRMESYLSVSMKFLAGAHFELKRIANADGKPLKQGEETRVEKIVTDENGGAEKGGLLPGIY